MKRRNQKIILPRIGRAKENDAALKRHNELSKDIRRIAFALLSLSFFCIFTLSQPDWKLIAIDGKLKVPFTGVEMPPFAFLVIGPSILILTTIYLHLFIEEWLAIKNLDSDKTLPFIFNLDSKVAKIISNFTFYALTPITLYFFFFKVRAFHNYFLWAVPWLVVSIMLFRIYSKRTNLGKLKKAGIVLSLLILPSIAAIPYKDDNLSSWHSIFAAITPLNLERANLAEHFLQEIFFGRANLRNSNLKGANLREADLGGAYLQEANLEDARLQGANLEGASLQGANLVRANLREANLGGAYLQEANLLAANIRRADLQAADLQGAYLQGAKLKRANLREADLGGAYLQEANLIGARLQGAILIGTNLKGAHLEEADLQGAYLQGAYLIETDLQRANLQGADLQEAYLDEADLTEADLTEADLRMISGINCAKLTKSKNWELSYRDQRLECGKPIPTKNSD